MAINSTSYTSGTINSTNYTGGTITSTNHGEYGLITAGDTVVTAGSTVVYANGLNSTTDVTLGGKLQSISTNYT